MNGIAVTTVMAVLACCAARSGLAAEAKVTVLPCPDPAPRFDYTKIDRTLKEPAYGSEKPLYRFFAFGPEGRQLMTVVADESGGTGKGYDAWYFDLNLNRDITEEGERFALPTPMAGRFESDGLFLQNYNPPKLFDRKALPVRDPVFRYEFGVPGGSFWFFKLTLRDESWSTGPLVMAKGNWSSNKNEAPVWRLGGSEFSLANEIILVPGGRGKNMSIVNRLCKPGERLAFDGSFSGFLGSSPNASWMYVAGGHRGIKLRAEMLDAPEALPIDIPLVKG